MRDLTEGEFALLRRAQLLAVKNGASQVDVPHFAVAFLDARPQVVEHWRSHGVDADGVRASLEAALRSQVWLPPGSDRFAIPAGGPLVVSTEVAALIREWREISPSGDASRIATSDLARNLLLCVPSADSAANRPTLQPPQPLSPRDTTLDVGSGELPPGLSEHGRDLTRLAATGGLDPLIGRDKEVDRIIRVLSRKKKRNPVLVGKAGVGKTVIVEGLALRIAAGDVPKSLVDARVVSLSLASLLGGTRYRGEFEGRLHSIIEEATTGARRTLLFVDEFHLIVKAGAAEGGLDMASLLLSAMARGDISV
ncbi:MAG: AAA family ATPase, partial [Acidothermaceae bacterium]